MSDWRDTEIQALNEYLGSPLFKETNENGIYTYDDKDECLKICVKPTGDYNYEVTINGHETTEDALEIVGNMIADTLRYWYNNNDSEVDKLWEEIFTTKNKSELSEAARRIIDEIIALEDKKNG